MIVVLVYFPHLFWLERSGFDPLPALKALPSLLVGEKRLMAWGNLLLLAAVQPRRAGGAGDGGGRRARGKRTAAPAVERVPVEPFAKAFVYFFALAPAFVATLLAVLLGRADAGRRRRSRSSCCRGSPSSWRRAT